MDRFLSNRLSDPRFGKRPIDAVTPWYSAESRFSPESIAPDAAGLNVTRYNASYGGGGSGDEGKKKKKKKKSGDGSATSDGTDGGRCWSDYDAVPGKEPYSEGSCQPEGKKKKKKKGGNSSD